MKKNSVQNVSKPILRAGYMGSIAINDITYPYPMQQDSPRLDLQTIPDFVEDYIEYLKFLRMFLSDLFKEGRILKSTEEYSITMQNDFPTIETLKSAFNAQLLNQITLDSLEAHRVTAHTLFEFMRFNPVRRQHIASLGSGLAPFELYWTDTIQVKQICNDMRLYCVDVADQLSDIFRLLSEWTKEHNREAIPKLDWLSFIPGDMNCVPLPSQSIDQIYCIMALHWSSDFKATIREMKRLLDPHGEKRIYLVLSGGPQAAITQNNQFFPIAITPVPIILDELENQGFTIRQRRTCMSATQVGQGGANLCREFVMAELGESVCSWRELANPWA